MPASRLMDPSLDGVIAALCADFDRRKRSIAEKNLPTRVLLEYKFLNFRILEAAIEVAGNENAELFIGDIGARRGYANTEIQDLSEISYKRKKAEIKRNIAKKLALS